MTRREQQEKKLDELMAVEREYTGKGWLTAGADEAGRGPLAGPVVVAACAIRERILGVNDSKKLSEKRREELFGEITAHAVCWSAAVIDVETIERINILEATRSGFVRAITGLSQKPDMVFTDAMDKLAIPYRYESVIKGDATIYSIAAASIIAKVTRDRLMREYDALYPEYGFAKHKGYGTAEHIAALREHGPCPIHRLSFLTRILP